MAANNTAKLSNFLSRVVANAQALMAARLELKNLTEELTSDAVIGALADGDCVGANAHLTRTIVFNYANGGMPLEAMLTNGAVATSNRLPNLLAVLPT